MIIKFQIKLILECIFITAQSTKFWRSLGASSNSLEDSSTRDPRDGAFADNLDEGSRGEAEEQTGES